MIIAETERLVIREMDPDVDAGFIYSLLNSPKFIRYIGDRGVRSAGDAREFIETRYRRSYRDNGFGLWAVETKDGGMPVGMCGFVKREYLDHPDIGFAFLPDHEKKGYGFESAAAVLSYGKEVLGFERVMAFTTPDNDASGRLLEKIGLRPVGPYALPDGEIVKLYSIDL